MSVYQPLADFLAAREADWWDASFADVQNVLRRDLPQSAFRHQAWWANQSGAGHSQTHGWRSVGWRTAQLDLERRRVTFERDRSGQRTDDLDTLIAQARDLTGIADKDRLMAAGLRALIAHTGAQGLAALGGTMPDFHAPPRERP